MKKDSVSTRLADFVCNTSIDDLPSDVLDKAKGLVLDTVGIGLSSSRMDFGISMIELVQRWGGAPEASIFGTNFRTTTQNAALCNGVLAHGQDYDDTHTGAVVHPTAALLPVMLAICEQRDIRGSAGLASLVVGIELAVRLGIVAPNRFHRRGFHTTSVTSTFAATALAAKLYGFDEVRAANALGIAGSFVSGLVECVQAGAGAKRLHAGWAAHSGILAAQIAAIDYSGPTHIFEGKLGLYNSMLSGEHIAVEDIFADLGQSWHVLDVRPKLYPCCHYLQAFIDCAAEIRKKASFDLQKISTIVCKVPDAAVNIVCEPWQSKLSPENGYEARFSLPYAVALMLVKGKATTEEYTDEAVSDAGIRSLMQKVTYEVDTTREVRDMGAYVEVRFHGAAPLSSDIPAVRGDRFSPIALSEIEQKFMQNVHFLPQEQASAICETIQNLESADSVREIVSSLSSEEARL